MSDINVISRTQKIIVDAASSSVSVINIGPQGPPGFLPTAMSYTVLGGTTGTQPTFSGTPMFSGSYVALGELVFFEVLVEFDNVTSFGTGQYYVTLPFLPAHPLMSRNGCLHDASTTKQYSIGGHAAAGSINLYLTYIGSNGHDEVFDHNSPITLTTADNFHVSGWYLKV